MLSELMFMIFMEMKLFLGIKLELLLLNMILMKIKSQINGIVLKLFPGCLVVIVNHNK